MDSPNIIALLNNPFCIVVATVLIIQFINDKIKQIMLQKYQNKRKDINELDNSTLSSIPNARYPITDDDWKIDVVDK